MSHWVYLMDETGPVPVSRHDGEGGTYQVGGSSMAEVNVTYNYSRHFCQALHPEGLRWLHGQRARETVAALERAVATLGTETAADYWAPTAGNAGHALALLLEWARQHPEAVWKIS